MVLLKVNKENFNASSQVSNFNNWNKLLNV